MLKHVLSAILSVFTAVVPGPSFPAKSIQPLKVAVDNSGHLGSCTAFSINQEARFWATAAHCVGEVGFQVDKATGTATPAVGLYGLIFCGHRADLVFVDFEHDIAVFQAFCSAPAIEKGEQPVADPIHPNESTKVKVYGYGWGDAVPMTFTGVVSHLNNHGYMLFDMRALPGHSGSPVLDEENKVISILQVGTNGVSGGATYQALHELDAYWGD